MSCHVTIHSRIALRKTRVQNNCEVLNLSQDTTIQRKTDRGKGLNWLSPTSKVIRSCNICNTNKVQKNRLYSSRVHTFAALSQVLMNLHWKTVGFCHLATAEYNWLENIPDLWSPKLWFSLRVSHPLKRLCNFLKCFEFRDAHESWSFISHQSHSACWMMLWVPSVDPVSKITAMSAASSTESKVSLIRRASFLRHTDSILPSVPVPGFQQILCLFWSIVLEAKSATWWRMVQPFQAQMITNEYSPVPIWLVCAVSMGEPNPCTVDFSPHMLLGHVGAPNPHFSICWNYIQYCKIHSDTKQRWKEHVSLRISCLFAPLGVSWASWRSLLGKVSPGHPLM